MGVLVVDEAERVVRAFLGRSYERHLARAHSVGLLADVTDLAHHEAAAVIWYTGNSSTRLLRRWREARMRRQDVAFTTVLERALTKLPLFDGSPIYRIIHVSAEHEERFRLSHRTGMETRWPVLASCSGGQTFRNGGNVRFVIAHRTGRWLGPYSWHPNEDEVVVPSGARFRSLAFVRLGPDEFEVELEEMVE